MEKIASDGWQMLDFESLSKEFDFDVLTKNGGVTNKMDLLVSFSEFVDASVKQLFDDDLKDGEISVRERSKSLESITSSLTNNTQSNDWLEWNSDMMKGTIKTFPERSQISENIKEQLIVEIYSK